MLTTLHSSGLINEIDLIKRLVAGDKDAFATLYVHYYSKLHRVAVTYLYLPEMADDVLQELFVKVWSNRLKLEGVENLSGYLFVMFRNMIVSEVRNKQKQNKIKAYVRAAYLNDSAAFLVSGDRELAHSIANIVEALPERQRLIFKLSREKGLNHTEISDLLAISPRTVSNTISLVLSHLKKSLIQQGLLFFSIFFFESCVKLSNCVFIGSY
ncbi:MAG: RNA polymerase sigma-70 factor [Agriterribacter sp.]